MAWDLVGSNHNDGYSGHNHHEKAKTNNEIFTNTCSREINTY